MLGVPISISDKPKITSITANSSSEITIKWGAVSGATSYEIRRKKAGDGEGWEYYKKAGTSTGTSYKDTGLAAGTHYYYGVVAHNGSQDSGNPGTANRMDLSTLTDKPKITSVATVSTSQLKVTWNAVNGAKSYDVYRRKEGDGEGWEYYKKVTNVTGTSWTDSGLLSGTKYHYGIVGINESGAGSGNPGADNRMNGTTLVAVTGVSLNTTAVTKRVGEPQTLTATVIPSNAANKSVTWSSSDTSVATVNSSGRVETHKAGTATITVKTADGGKTASCKVTVLAAGSEMSSGYDRVLPDGDYRIVSAADPRFFLDIPGGDAAAANGSNVQIYGPAEGGLSAHDVWTITYSDGFYSICQKDSTASLDVKDGSMELGTNVQVWQKNNNSSQKWAISIINWAEKGYRIQSKCSGMSLDIAGGNIASGTNVQQYTVNTSNAQRWLFIPYEPGRPVADGKYMLVSGLGSHVEMDVPGNTGDIADGTSIQIWNDGTNNKFNSFDVRYVGDGYYNLIHAASGKYVGVKDGTVDNYGDIQLFAPDGSNSQKWCMVAQNGGYMLVNRHSGLVIDVDSGKTENATNVRQHFYNGAKAQTWMFKKAEYSVSYDANGGTGAPSAQTKYYANALTLSTSVPSAGDRKFIGWATQKDAVTAQYQPGASYTTDSDVILYAVWEGKTQSHSIDLSGMLDGKQSATLGEYGTADVYINGVQEADDVTDYSESWPQGTDYEIRDIKAKEGYVYEGAAGDSLSGTVGTGDIGICLKFTAKEEIPEEGEGKAAAGRVSGSEGTTVAVPVMLEENPGIIGISLDLGYDSSRVKLVKVESGELLDGSSMSGDYMKNPYRLSLSNDMSTEDIEGTGVLATAYFEILDGEEGEIPVTLSFREAYDKDLNEVKFRTSDGAITVTTYKPGDVNRDGSVKLNDAILLRRYVAGWDVEIDERAGDVNGDGSVKLNDAILLRRYVAGWDVVLK